MTKLVSQRILLLVLVSCWLNVAAQPLYAWGAQGAYRNIPASKRLGQPYFSTNRPVVDGQLSKAGLRLASTLNDLFRAP